MKWAVFLLLQLIVFSPLTGIASAGVKSITNAQNKTETSKAQRAGIVEA